MRKSRKYSKTGQDLLTNLPSEITIDILTRLPPRTILVCKFVHKSLRDLIEAPEFAKSYKSGPPCLAVFEQENTRSKPYKVSELDDENSCMNEAFNFSFPHPAPPLHSSVNGLLLLFEDSKLTRRHNLIVCNPITRDYIEIPSPDFSNTPELLTSLNCSGFGVSKTTGSYKLVRIFRRLQNDSYYCLVCTLGSGGLWRSTALTCSSIVYESNTVGVFLNGNIHWLASDLKGFPRISCFDLETELFTTTPLSPPPHLDMFFALSLSALSDRLALCEASGHEIVIWLMSDYGDEKSWTKQFAISPLCPYVITRVISMLKDGEILIKSGEYIILCCSNKTQSIRVAHLVRRRHSTSIVLFTPSFLPLKTLFPMEKPRSF